MSFERSNPKPSIEHAVWKNIGKLGLAAEHRQKYVPGLVEVDHEFRCYEQQQDFWKVAHILAELIDYSGVETEQARDACYQGLCVAHQVMAEALNRGDVRGEYAIAQYFAGLGADSEVSPRSAFGDAVDDFLQQNPYTAIILQRYFGLGIERLRNRDRQFAYKSAAFLCMVADKDVTELFYDYVDGGIESIELELRVHAS